MQVERSAWEREVMVAVTSRLRDSAALLGALDIQVERLAWLGTDPDTTLEIVVVHAGRRHERRWQVWGELSGTVQPVPHPDAVAGVVLSGVVAMPPAPRRATHSKIGTSSTPLPIIGRNGEVRR